MNVQLRPGWQEGSDGWPAAGCPAAGARGGYSASWSLVPLPRSSQAWGWCRGVGPPRRAGAREGGGRRRVRRAVRCGSESLSRGGVEAVLPQGRTVRRHLPGPLPGTVPPGRGVPGPRWPVMSPGGVWLGAATGLPGWGPADRVAHVQDPLLRGPVRAPRSPKAVLFCRPPLPRPWALSWLRPPAAVWARAGLGEDVGRTGPNYRAGWGGSPHHAEDPARSPPVTARARTGGTEVPPRHPRAHYHAGKGRRTWCGLVTSCPRRLGRCGSAGASPRRGDVLPAQAGGGGARCLVNSGSSALAHAGRGGGAGREPQTAGVSRSTASRV